MAEIGKVLAARRAELNYSLSEVSQLLKIREKYLKHIESGDLDKIPGEVYIKGYVKEYAKLLKFKDLEEIKILDTKKTPNITCSELLKNNSSNTDIGVILPTKFLIFVSIISIFIIYLLYSKI